MIAFEGGLLGVGALLIMGPRVGGARPSTTASCSPPPSGILFGVCNVGVKALTGIVGDDGLDRRSSARGRAVALVGSAAAFYASARSLQDGEAVAVIAITGTAANICCIAGGIIVFGDPMPGDAVGIVVQAVAFLLVIVASALTPAPRAASGRARALPPAQQPSLAPEPAPRWPESEAPPMRALLTRRLEPY